MSFCHLPQQPRQRDRPHCIHVAQPPWYSEGHNSNIFSFLELLLKLLIMLPGSVELISTLFDVDFKV